jgi:hypothetical protein
MHGTTLDNIHSFMTLTIWTGNDGMLRLIQCIHDLDGDREIFQQ